MKLNSVSLGAGALVLHLLIPAVAYADNASHCIRMGEGERSQSFTNTCAHPVEIFWCHTRKEAAYQRSLCGIRGQFFQKQAVLQPGEVKQNQFAIPYHSTLHFAVCAGGHGSVKIMDTDGNYLCR